VTFADNDLLDTMAEKDWFSPIHFIIAFVGGLLSVYWTRVHNLFDGPRMRTNAPVSTSEDRMWRAQKERQQQGAREAGRIGYIGNEGPVCN
jgi:hypothetical protein